MTTFPFTEADWFCVSEAARAIVNATFADDAVLRVSRFAELRQVLAQLRGKYGQHPALLETEADFTDEPSERVALYEEAKRLAEDQGLITYTIRLSLARVLLEELQEPERALREVLACREEVATLGDEGDRAQWEELHAECIHRTSACP
jgi:hypothetical protein